MSNIAELHEKVYAHLTENHPKLRFTLRKINRGGRLDSGYWFHGNDQYLLFTFWDYWDANTKTPLIYFSTWIGNTTDLSLAVEHCADSEINDFFVNELRPVLDIKEIYKTIKHTDGLLAAIDLAINHDKKIIDTLINGNKYISTIIKPVEEELFNRTKDNIERYRNAKLITTEQDDEIFEYKDTKFQELNIKNIRHISPTRLDFHQNLTCFIGMNGTGKTTLLQAIALAAVRNEKNYFLQNTLQEDKITWLLRMEMDKKSRLPLFSKNGHIELFYVTNNDDGDNAIDFVGLEQKSVAANRMTNTNLFHQGKGYYNTLILGFPQVKSEIKIDMSDAKVDFPNLYDCSSLVNGDGDGRFANVQRWFFSLYNEGLSQAHKQSIPLKETKEHHVLDFSFDIISKIMNQKISLEDTKYYGADELTWLNIDGKMELMNVMSQGYESIMTWVGYLIQRLYDIQPNTPYKNLVDIPAIVLIDEIDTYLHISVQQKILAVLVEKFPNIQFIVTTHSPYVLGSIPKDKIKIYVCKKENESVEIEEFTEFTAYGADVERLSRWLFDTNEINREVQDMLHNIFRLIENRELDTAEQAIANAAEIIAHNHPRLEEARMIIETQRMFNL